MEFSHSGATGDIIFSLPTIRAMGGGTLYITNFDKQNFLTICYLTDTKYFIK